MAIMLALLIGAAWMFIWSVAWWRVKRTTKHSDSLMTYGIFVGAGLFAVIEVIYFTTGNSPLSLIVGFATFGMVILAIAVLRTVNRRLLAKQPIT